MLINRSRFLFNANSGGNNGNGGPPPTPTPAPAPQPPPSPTQGFANGLARHNGDAGQFAERLYDENFQLRETRRQLESQLETLRGQVPAESAVILTGDQAAAWAAYQELGTPDELKQQGTQLNQMTRQQQIAKAAEASGYKASVLSTLIGEAEIEMRQVTQDGQQVDVAYIKAGDGEAVSLTEHAQGAWADFMPALTAAGQGAPPQGQQFIRQTPGAPQPKKDAVDNFLSEKQEGRGTNPLIPS